MANKFYDVGWNAFVDGKPNALGNRSWRDGWLDAQEAKATKHMGSLDAPKIKAIEKTVEWLRDLIGEYLTDPDYAEIKKVGDNMLIVTLPKGRGTFSIVIDTFKAPLPTADAG